MKYSWRSTCIHCCIIFWPKCTRNGRVQSHRWWRRNGHAVCPKRTSQKPQDIFAERSDFLGDWMQWKPDNYATCANKNDMWVNSDDDNVTWCNITNFLPTSLCLHTFCISHRSFNPLRILFWCLVISAIGNANFRSLSEMAIPTRLVPKSNETSFGAEIPPLLLIADTKSFKDINFICMGASQQLWISLFAKMTTGDRFWNFQLTLLLIIFIYICDHILQIS